MSGRRFLPSWRIAPAVISIALVVLALGASGSTNKATKAGGPGPTTKGGAPQTFKVGDVVKLGSWTVKVWAVKDPQPPVNEYSKPDAGNRWVSIDTEVKNLSTKVDAVSSLACFNLHDSLNHDYSEDIAAGIAPGAPDGEVEPNGAKRGLIVFQVPQAAKGLQLRFKCDLFSTGTAIIKLS